MTELSPEPFLNVDKSLQEGVALPDVISGAAAEAAEVLWRTSDHTAEAHGLLASYNPAAPFCFYYRPQQGKARDRPGPLEGAVGIALALRLAGAGPRTEVNQTESFLVPGG
jgi:hypothetical protein